MSRWTANVLPSPPGEVLGRLGVQVDGSLGGRAHHQWLVSSGDARYVLRRYPEEPLGDIDYELTVLRHLKSLGWPVPVPVEGPFDVQGRTWCLFERLPGTSTAQRVSAESVPVQRQRGHLLAELHADVETLVDLRQRPGWRRAEAVVADPELWRRLEAYGKLFPESAGILRWHADRARERFEALDLRNRQLIVLHGDFVGRNLLCQGGQLTGIVDFESTHLDHRVAEFALAWQGRYDDVIVGYEHVHPLDDVDCALLAPTLWSWLLLGVATDIGRMTAGIIEPHGFEWQVGRLLRRSPSMGAEAAPYPGR